MNGPLFARDPFDIAPAAQRPTRAAWLLLALSTLFAAFAATMLERSLAAVGRAEEAARAREQAQRVQAQREAAARARANDPATLEQLRAQQQLQRTLRMSWSGLFDALEHAAHKVEGRVTVTSVAPVRTQTNGAEVSIAGLALTNDVLLLYVEALQDEKHVTQATLTSQQLAQTGGMPVSRFHLSLEWEPTP